MDSGEIKLKIMDILIRGSIAVIGIGAVVWGFSGQWKQIQKKLNPPSKSLNHMSKVDLWQQLNNEKLKVNLRGSALLQLMRRRDDRGFSVVESWANSEEIAKRKWAALSHRFLATDGLEKLKIMAKDPNRSIRKKAYNGILLSNDKSSIEFVENL